MKAHPITYRQLARLYRANALRAERRGFPRLAQSYRDDATKLMQTPDALVRW